AGAQAGAQAEVEMQPDAPACAAPDRDHDGISDTDDQCPDQPETVNGVDDDDGCPDTGGLAVTRLAGDRLAVDRVPTLDGDELSRGGEIIVDQMALVMRGHAEVTRWLVAIAQPSASDAQRVAAAVVARLIARGVPADRIELLAGGGASRIGGVAKERGAALPTCGKPGAAAPPTEAPASPPAAARPAARKPAAPRSAPAARKR
ncbi:MAG TPA: hypothetical protein VK601_12180, partial [Kofleriaceae bacterium]|nr:hypothetical protein [Kofleriaceae bacterium]